MLMSRRPVKQDANRATNFPPSAHRGAPCPRASCAVGRVQKAHMKQIETITPSRARNGTAKPSVIDAVTIPAPDIRVAEFKLVGTAPYVQLKFSEKAKGIMRSRMSEGTTAKSKKTREARDYNAEFEAAIHRSAEGWAGIPAAAFRSGCIRACSLVGYKMILAKLSFFVLADGYDAGDGTPLIRITGEPEHVEHMVRNDNGSADIRVRAMWREWSTVIRVRYDAGQFTLTDLTNLISRVGSSVGIGEGRASSPDSCGMGWGFFDIANEN